VKRQLRLRLARIVVPAGRAQVANSPFPLHGLFGRSRLAAGIKQIKKALTDLFPGYNLRALTGLMKVFSRQSVKLGIDY